MCRASRGPLREPVDAMKHATLRQLKVFEAVALADELPDFLTLTAYDRL